MWESTYFSTMLLRMISSFAQSPFAVIELLVLRPDLSLSAIARTRREVVRMMQTTSIAVRIWSLFGFFIFYDFYAGAAQKLHSVGKAVVFTIDHALDA